MKLQHISLAVLLSVGLATAAHAGVAGKSSDETRIVVGSTGTLGDEHPNSGVGLGIKSLYGGAIVAFSGFSGYADGNSVVRLTPHLAGLPPSHSGIGYANYKQVAGQDVYFGEWYAAGTGDSASTPVRNQATHTVYFNGKDADTSVPSTGSATYAVQGINNYNGSNLLSGNFTANFGTKQLTGSITDGSRTFDVGTATINNNATITGINASWSGTTTATNGQVSGQFYNSQASLAGYATFANRANNIAFGGKK